LSSPFKETKMKNTRYALLAGTMLLPGLALPHWSMAAPLSVSSTQGPIILAQVDPKEKEKEKAKQLQKGVPPQPKGTAPQAVPPSPPPGQPQALPQQRLVPQPGTQQGLQNVQPPPGTPKQRVVPQPGTQQGLQNVQPPQGLPQQRVVPQPGTQQGLQNVQPPQGLPQQRVVPQPGTQQGLQNVQPPPGGLPQQRVVPQPGTQQGLQNVQPPTGPVGLPKGAPTGPQQGLQNVTPPALPQQRLQSPPAAAGLPKGPAGPQSVQPPLGQPGQITSTPPSQQVLQQQKQILQPQGIGTVDALRSQRRERMEGKTVIIQEPGNRVIVRENGRAFIRHDETQRFRIWGQPHIEHRGHEQYAYITRPGGYQVITVTDGSGRLLRRVRRGPDGREFVLIDNRPRHGVGAAIGAGFAAGVILGLAAPVVTIPRERYIVDVSAAPPALLYETLEAPPVVEIERPYSLDEIRYNVALRDRMRRIDIDAITFDSGSWEVAQEQYPRLQAIAEAMGRILANNPNEMFMIEGHTDAVGNDVDNLSLSDRRAESVAVILTDVYQIPPENLVTQGYGEQHLKVPTDGPSRENRRVAARRITPLLQGNTLASR
jgi:outer membrane protein OmpA-like peptidoglycan-associated protein